MDSISGKYQVHRPAIFDWMVFSLSILLGFIFPSLGDFIRSQAFSLWMLGVVVFYTLGSWLKHLPLSHRLQRPQSKKEMGYVIFLVAGHWVIMLVIMIFSEPAFFRLIGIQPLTAEDSGKSAPVFIIMILAGFVTWLVYRNKILPKSYKPKNEQYLFWRELIADIFLILSIPVLSFVIWEEGIMAMLSRKPVESLSEVWFLFILLSFAYLLLYLPLRYLYLIEDRGRQNFRRMKLLFAFLLLRSLFEILSN